MRIAVSGTACTGKSTLIRAFLQKWPSYTTPKITYRDIIKQLGYAHSKHTNKATQTAILAKMYSDLEQYPKGSKVIYDRCPLDVLVYSLWAYENGESDIDEAFIKELIPIVRESMRHLDIIFFIPLTDAAPITVVDDGFRETDEKFIHEIDNIFKSFEREYRTNIDNSVYFPKDDSPAIIEIFGSTQERLYMIGQYLDAEGDLIGGYTPITPAEAQKNIEALLMGQLNEYNANREAIEKKKGPNFTKPKKRK